MIVPKDLFYIVFNIIIMKRTALKIGYIGTNFHGFQRQPNLRTVEEELIYHLRKLDYIDDLKNPDSELQEEPMRESTVWEM